MRILAISGSLRVASSNTALLRAATALAPAGMEVVLYGGLGDLPHFNPDLEGAAPPAVIDLWAGVREADGLLIASLRRVAVDLHLTRTKARKSRSLWHADLLEGELS
jgi:hypothetical protein